MLTVQLLLVACIKNKFGFLSSPNNKMVVLTIVCAVEPLRLKEAREWLFKAFAE